MRDPRAQVEIGPFRDIAGLIPRGQNNRQTRPIRLCGGRRERDPTDQFGRKKPFKHVLRLSVACRSVSTKRGSVQIGAVCFGRRG